MKELLTNLKSITLDEAKSLTLIDTCFLIHLFEHPDNIQKFKEKMSSGKYAITSFNIEELMHVEHHLNKKVKEELRKFLKNPNDIYIINVEVHPGNMLEEKQFIQNHAPEILSFLRDYSDGIMYAVAIKTKSNIITRDKHHIYNQISENFANKHNINIMNKI